MVWDAVLLPFGTAHSITGAVTYNQRFPGQYFDAETGLHYNYRRDYDPRIGRYIQADPIGLAGSVNRYVYVRGSPPNLTDPSGTVAAAIPVGAVLLGAAILATPQARQALSDLGKALSNMLNNMASNDNNNILPFPEDRIRDKSKTGTSSVPVPPGNRQICPLRTESKKSCYYICPDGSEVFLIKGWDCADDKCATVVSK